MGLSLLGKKGFRKFMIECDSKIVVEWITKEECLQRVREPVANTINRCKELMLRDWDVKLTHVYREQNRVSDYLAGHAFVKENGLQVFGSHPRDVVQHLERDKADVPMVRRVGSC